MFTTPEFEFQPMERIGKIMFHLQNPAFYFHGKFQASGYQILTFQRNKDNKLRWYSPTAATFYSYKPFWSVLRSQALETPHLGFRELMAANPVEPDLALHQSLPDLLRNLLWNPVEPDLALQGLPEPSPEPSPEPAPVHTGAILGWRPH